MKMILFDVDGTLIRTGGAGIASLNRAFAQSHGIQDAMSVIQPAGKTDPAIIREIYKAKLHRDCAPQEMDALSDAYLAFLAEEIARAANFRVMPGIAEILDRLHAMPDRCLVGLVTGNLERGSRIKLGRPDLNRFFRFGGFGSDSESRPELTKIGIARGRSLQKHPSHNKDIYLVGDTPHDIDAGKKAAVTTLAVATGPWKTPDLQPHQPDFLFEDFSDTGAFFRAVGL